tara:strand:+ start:4876 stop:5820 length:945 start_codon:yes stop_codon:yes gene_type:complete
MKMRGANVPSKSTAGIGYLEGTDGMGLMTGLAVASLASSAIGSWLQNRAQNKATQAGIRANQQAQATTRQGELFNRQMARAEMNRNMPRARIANAALQWGMKDTGAKEAGFFDYHPSTWDPNYVMTADQGRLQRQIDEDIAMENQRKHRGFGMATYASPSQDYGMAPYSSPRESLTMSDMVMSTPQGTFQEAQVTERPSRMEDLLLERRRRELIEDWREMRDRSRRERMDEYQQRQQERMKERMERRVEEFRERDRERIMREPRRRPPTLPRPMFEQERFSDVDPRLRSRPEIAIDTTFRLPEEEYISMGRLVP